MNIQTMEQQKREGGFTLVELAIVMIIIGLLIGGILKGQELISNSQVTATIAQVKGIDAALSTFRDKYAALPGDMGNPAQRLPCGAACLVATTFPAATGVVGQGLNDGRINAGDPGVAPVPTTEGTVAFSHLAAADLLSGIEEANAGIVIGRNLPEAKVGGGFTIAYTINTLTNAVAAPRAGHYLTLNGTNGVVNGTNGALVSARAAQIDRKLDDGLPNSGSAIVNTGTRCIENAAAAGAPTYNENDNTSLCAMYFRVQG